jgi:transposase
MAATVATRARIVLWHDEHRPKKQIAELAGVTRPTVDLWLGRYSREGVAGLLDRPRGAGREQMPAAVRARVLALSRQSPPVKTGLSHWSSRELARYVTRTEGVSVSHFYEAKLWRDNGLRPHRHGTFKISRDPEFAEKVADIVGLYLDPPGGAVVLSLDEKTQIQALDRTQPLLPMTFDATEKRTHDYVRHGTTNLFAALNVGTGEVYGQCKPTRNGADFLAFLKAAVKPHAGQQVHVVLDNLSTHSTPDVAGLAERKSHRALPFHPGRFLLVEPDRKPVRHHHPAVDPSRHLHLGQGTDQPDPHLHHPLEHQPRTVRVDRHRRRDLLTSEQQYYGVFSSYPTAFWLPPVLGSYLISRR